MENIFKKVKEVFKIREFNINELERRKKIVRELFEYILPFTEKMIGIKFYGSFMEDLPKAVKKK